jgi:hypothetical protein
MREELKEGCMSMKKEEGWYIWGKDRRRDVGV